MVISPPGSAALPSTGVSEPLVSVTLPVERYLGVARLVTAGVAARLNLSYEAIDDLQLAVELVVAAAFEPASRATVSFASDGSELTILISPVDGRVLETTRAGFDTEAPVRLQSLLERLVDSVGTSAGPVPAIALRKALGASRP